MKRFYIFKDGTMQSSTATKKLAIDLIRQYQKLETHPLLCSQFSIIAGEEEFIPYPSVHIGGYARFVCHSLVVLVIAFSMPFEYTWVTIKRKENDTMPETRNLCAQVPIDLHQKISKAREQAGQTTAQYITALITEYFKMKENGGNEIMMNGKTRTLAFQIDVEL